jgi:polar amino acid transport system substrate-binding protein
VKQYIGALVLGATLLAGCGYDATVVPEPEPAEPAAPASTSDCKPNLEQDLRSYAPDGITAAEARKDLRVDGRLVVGVSADTYRMASLNPETNEIEGFDIDVAQRIADELGVALQLRVINAADRIPLLQEGEIDLVVRNMTINCARWEQIAFSAEYYRATQKVLLPAGTPYEGPADLAGKKVCAPTGSTSVANIEEKEPEVETAEAANHTGCLIKFQQGEVDAITGDDTVLAGLAAQDPYAEVPDQDALTQEPYGVGANAGDVALVRFVNDVLEDMEDDGSWEESYNRWLRPYLKVKASPPERAYGRPLP